MPLESEALEKIAMPNRGRLVAVELSQDNESYRLYVGYGGRSPSSKNRHTIFLPDLNGGSQIARTAIYNDTDPALLGANPEATLYNAQRQWSSWHVASNGEQTDGMGAILKVTNDFELAQEAYDHEGPKNANTPHITAALTWDLPRHDIYMGRIYCLPESPKIIERKYWEIGEEEFPIVPGYGYLEATYDGMGGTGTNFDDPWSMKFGKTLEDGMEMIWEAWDPNTKANIIAKEISRKTGASRYITKSIHPPKQKA